MEIKDQGRRFAGSIAGGNQKVVLPVEAPGEDALPAKGSALHPALGITTCPANRKIYEFCFQKVLGRLPAPHAFAAYGASHSPINVVRQNKPNFCASRIVGVIFRGKVSYRDRPLHLDCPFSIPRSGRQADQALCRPGVGEINQRIGNSRPQAVCVENEFKRGSFPSVAHLSPSPAGNNGPIRRVLLIQVKLFRRDWLRGPLD